MNHLPGPLASAVAPVSPYDPPFPNLPLYSNVFNNNHFQNSQASTLLEYQFIVKPIVTKPVSHLHNHKVDPRSASFTSITNTPQDTYTTELVITTLYFQGTSLVPSSQLLLPLSNLQHQRRQFAHTNESPNIKSSSPRTTE